MKNNSFQKTLADFTSPALMVPELRSKASTAVIGELCTVLERDGRLGISAAAFYEAVMSRESLCPTGTAHGWALPHARLKGLTQLSFVLARSPQPLVWPGAHGAGVDLVFLFAVPEAEARIYLSVISALARLSKNPALLEELTHAPESMMMFSLLKQVALRENGRATTASRLAVA